MAFAPPLLCVVLITICVSTCAGQQIRHAAAIEFVYTDGQPAYRRTDPQLVVYTRTLSPKVLQLARVIDGVAATQNALRCLVIINSKTH